LALGIFRRCRVTGFCARGVGLALLAALCTSTCELSTLEEHGQPQRICRFQCPCLAVLAP